MNRFHIKWLTVTILLIASLPAFAEQPTEAIASAIAGEHRESKNSTRDSFRHPLETLLFFGIKPNMQVLEILPGRGWYTEILAPLLSQNGQLTVASYGAEHSHDYLKGIHLGYAKKLNQSPKVYGKTNMILFQTKAGYLSDVATDSQDMVLTFRSTHNWIRFGNKEKAVFEAFYRVLKKNGVLGVVQHRAPKDASLKASSQKGYVPETYIIKLAEGIGFELVAKSEINSNLKDTKNHPEGVWTLPPSYRLGDKDKAKYQAIGESDRMTLKFIKF